MALEYIDVLQTELDEMERELAERSAQERKFKRLFAEQQAFVNRRIRQARMAAMAHNEEFALRALSEKKSAEAVMKQYRENYELNKAAVDELRRRISAILEGMKGEL
ncbi:PspA/IM30 family protein [Paenibacillus aceti]|uniref:Uncharacterized protein n=1 Tax=Paenibacillus aceti TaxID=1820010 RepID=A0ABQ1W512_9BACL|nr:PspA/IM30 family protein [Paenibacillus aceti]GGG11723.1 hypothetical protein GCM10010913_36910 [Paenibacillus aceti]